MTDRERYIDILKILYLRLMNLRFRYRSASIAGFDAMLIQRCPDVCDSMQWMFACDAYVTVSGMFESGAYSFEALVQYNSQIKTLLDDARTRIDNEIPGFKEIRNKTFAHFVNKRNPDVVSQMFKSFESILAILCNYLHAGCMRLLDVSESDIGGYTSERFIKMNEEIHDFADIIITGSGQKMTEEFQEKLTAILEGRAGHAN